MRPLTIGISGGTGSGKTRFTKEVLKRCDKDNVICISQDSYYKDLSKLSYEERCKNNFDNPKSIDFSMLLSDLSTLLKNEEVYIPIYDFTTHTRKENKEHIAPKPIIILEGIFSLFDEKIRNLLEKKIYVDTPADIRILRRVKRDIKKRGRSIESIVKQYTETVRPMHKKFIAPVKIYADIIVPNGGKNLEAIDIINTQLLPIIRERIKDA